MSEIKQQLRNYFETIAPPTQLDLQAQVRRFHPIAAVALGAAIVAVPILLGWALFRPGAVDETIPPATTVTATPATTSTIPQTTTAVESEETTSTTTRTVDMRTTTTVLDTIGSWSPIADAPWAYPSTVRAWTGTELLVFPEYQYGLEAPETGLAYNPTTNQWRTLTAPPELRGAPATVWTGDKLIVWGGIVSESAEDGYLLSNTGFAYDPAADRWDAIAASPLEAQQNPFFVWTGEEMIVGGGGVVVDNYFLSQTVAAAAYDPETDTWREVDPGPFGGRNPGVSVWTGTEMIVGGNGDRTDGDASWWAYNPEYDTWRQLPDPPERTGNVYEGAWTGTEVVFSMDGSQTSSSVYALDPTTGIWRQAQRPGRRLPYRGSAWTGRYVVFWGKTGNPDTPAVSVAWDPATDTWLLLSDSPLAGRFPGGTPAIIGPGRLLFWGGTIDDGPVYADGAILDLNP